MSQRAASWRAPASRRYVVLVSTLFVLLASPLAFGAEAEIKANDLLGRYWFPDRSGQVELFEKDGKYFGKVISYNVEGQLDSSNPDPELQKRPFVGIEMFSDFEFDADDGHWVDGTIYDADSGTTYSCDLWFEDGDLSTLWARGYIGISLFGRTESFARAKEP